MAQNEGDPTGICSGESERERERELERERGWAERGQSGDWQKRGRKKEEKAREW